MTDGRPEPSVVIGAAVDDVLQQSVTQRRYGQRPALPEGFGEPVDAGVDVGVAVLDQSVGVELRRSADLGHQLL